MKIRKDAQNATEYERWPETQYKVYFGSGFSCWQHMTGKGITCEGQSLYKQLQVQVDATDKISI